MKIKNFIVGLFAAIFLLQNGVFGFNEQRVRGGTATPPGMFEFLTLLRPIIEGPGIDKIVTGTCSSTIISPRHILTAAHCVIIGSHTKFNGSKIYRSPVALMDYRPMEKMVIAEQLDEMTKVQLPLQNFSIQPRFYFHSSYLGENDIYAYHSNTVQPINHDIAIIEFPEGTNLSITPITLVSNYVEKDGETAIASGYGTYKDPPNEKPETLLNATVPVYLPGKCPVVQTLCLICTGILNLHADSGDSGGPLMIKRNEKYYQVGIAAVAGAGGARYTRISNYCDWISKITKGAAKCELLPDENSPSPNRPNESVTPENPSQTEPLNSNSNTYFAFNILFLLFSIFFFV